MYLRKLPAALAAATLVLAVPASAQSAAAPLSVSRASAAVDGENNLEGGNTFGIVLGVLAAGAFIYGLVEFMNDDNDNPVSP